MSEERVSRLGLQFGEMISGVVITAIGISLMIKSGLGQTAITAFTQNIATVLNIKGGTVIGLLYVGCVAGQILILGKDFEKIQLFQLLIAYLQGQIVNLICYDLPLISTLEPGSYLTAWLCMILGILGCSFGIAMWTTADFIRNPFEELVIVLSKKWSIDFTRLQVRADMMFILLSLVLIIGFRLDFTTLREGTWVSMFLLGRSMRYTFPIAQKLSFSQR